MRELPCNSRILLLETAMGELKNAEIRRLFLPEDAHQIELMQAQANVFREHYPKHAEWLAKSLPEVLNGKRIAFGAFRSAINEHSKLIFELVGSVILKINHYKAAAELKNLFVREDVRGSGYGKALLDKTIDYCTKVGLNSIETEVPVTELNTVVFLHRIGFTVAATYDSLYKSDDPLYRMHRALQPRFTGDIFDSVAFFRWIIVAVFEFRIVSENQNKHLLHFDLLNHDIKISQFDETTGLRGAAFVKKGSVDSYEIVEAFGNEEAQVRLAFADHFDSTASETCSRLRISPFDRNLIEKDFSHYFAHRLMEFPRDQIAGFVLNINQNLFERVRGLTAFSLFKNGSLGKYLKRGDTLLLVSEPSADHPLGGVGGVGTINDSHVGRPKDVWGRFGSDSTLFTRNEFDGYAREEGEVLGLQISDFHFVPMVDYHVLVRDIIREDVEIAELGCCYLSRSMVDRFKLLTAAPTSQTDIAYDFALSFAGEDRARAEALASVLSERGTRVFYDKYEEADLLGKDLYQHLQSIYRDRARFCVIFLSQNYARKLWTRHELKQAQARAFEQSVEYILPIKLDDTEIPGINRTVGYIDLRLKTIQDVADLLLAKLQSLPKRIDN
jgi:GNAT superfamily N-acetyltransferase